MLIIIIVNYKNENKTIEYIQSEVIKISTPYKVVVVNNAAVEYSDNLLADRLSAQIISGKDFSAQIDTVRTNFIVSHPDNLGFAKGNNLGVEFARKYFEVDYILFSNNDIRLLDSNVVEELLDKMKILPQVGIIGPRVIGLKGEEQSPEPYYPFWLRYFGRYWLQPFLSPRMNRRVLMFNYSENAQEGEHYKVMGSFFIVRAIDYQECGGMDPNTFLFGEEVILTERMNAIGKLVYYYPKVTILHEHGGTISQNANNTKIRRLEFESESYYYNKYKKIPLFMIWLGRLSMNLYTLIKKNKG